MKKDRIFLITLLFLGYLGFQHFRHSAHVVVTDEGLKGDSHKNQIINSPLRQEKRMTLEKPVLAIQGSVVAPIGEGPITGEEKKDLKSKYPQIREVLFRVPMTKEIWDARLQRMPAEFREAMEKVGGMPETAIITPDDEPIVSSDDIKPVSDCAALQEANSAVTVSINEKGQVQDIVNTDPENQDPIPEGIYGCTFQPYTSQGATGPVTTALIPQNELKIAAQYIKQAYQQRMNK